MGFQWTDKITQDVIERWNAGESCTTIGDSYGVSRNTIIGKMKRLRDAGWPVRDGLASVKPIDLTSKKLHQFPKATPDWSEEQTKEVIDKWNAGISGSEIASEIGRTYGSVKAKLERLYTRGLITRGQARVPLSRGRPMSRAEKPQAKRRETYGIGKRDEARIASITALGERGVEQFEAAMTGVGIPLLEIRGSQCRWPTGGAPDWKFCGEPVVAGSYCPKCSARAYQRFASHNDQVRAA